MHHFFVTLGYAFNFPDKGVSEVVMISGGMRRRLASFTVCMWMSSTNNRGTLFSYAVPGNVDELLIKYNRVFALHIGRRKR